MAVEMVAKEMMGMTVKNMVVKEMLAKDMGRKTVKYMVVVVVAEEMVAKTVKDMVVVTQKMKGLFSANIFTKFRAEPIQQEISLFELEHLMLTNGSTFLVKFVMSGQFYTF